jgi:hypothetical protein
MPDAFLFPNSPELWLPLGQAAPGRAFGVLRPGRAAAIASAELTSLNRQFEIATP